ARGAGLVGGTAELGLAGGWGRSGRCLGGRAVGGERRRRNGRLGLGIGGGHIGVGRFGAGVEARHGLLDDALLGT
nr:hypothetical protein [Tanacetum cinerariifolium]